MKPQPYILTPTNRSFRYGDGLFETMKMVDGKILFFDHHIARLQKGMQVLKMEFPSPSPLGESLSRSSGSWGDGIKKEILLQAEKNNLQHSAKIRLQVYRNGVGEGYIPDNNEVGYVIETSTLADENYVLNQKGIRLGLYTDFKKPQNILSNLKTSNALYSVLAGIYAKEQQFDDCLLLNESGFVAEAISSNIFIVKNKILYTPSLDQACLDGIMRKVIMEQARRNNIQVIEKPISIHEIQEADEVFLSNVIKGIVSVQSFMDIQYSNTFTMKVHSCFVAFNY